MKRFIIVSPDQSLFCGRPEKLVHFRKDYGFLRKKICYFTDRCLHCDWHSCKGTIKNGTFIATFPSRVGGLLNMENNRRPYFFRGTQKLRLQVISTITQNLVNGSPTEASFVVFKKFNPIFATIQPGQPTDAIHGDNRQYAGSGCAGKEWYAEGDRCFYRHI